METLLKPLLFGLFLSLLSACDETPAEAISATAPGEAVTEAPVPEAVPAAQREEVAGLQVLELKFPEITVSIDFEIPFEYPTEEAVKLTDSTASVELEVAQSVEGQRISLRSDRLTDLSVEQRYETSVTVSDEGPHCDMLDWKHFVSDWVALERNRKGQFITDVYTEADWERFPAVSPEELKAAIAEHCGESWTKDVRSLTEGSAGVGISRVFFRISGKDKVTGAAVVKIIDVWVAMGC